MSWAEEMLARKRAIQRKKGGGIVGNAGGRLMGVADVVNRSLSAKKRSLSSVSLNPIMKGLVYCGKSHNLRGSNETTLATRSPHEFSVFCLICWFEFLMGCGCKAWSFFSPWILLTTSLSTCVTSGMLWLQLLFTPRACYGYCLGEEECFIAVMISLGLHAGYLILDTIFRGSFNNSLTNPLTEMWNYVSGNVPLNPSIQYTNGSSSGLLTSSSSLWLTYLAMLFFGTNVTSMFTGLAWVNLIGPAYAQLAFTLIIIVNFVATVLLNARTVFARTCSC